MAWASGSARAPPIGSVSEVSANKRVWRKEVHLLTGAQCSFEPQAVEIVTFAVSAPHLSKLVRVAGALSAQTVPSSVADRAPLLWDAVVIISRTVVLQGALAFWAQTTLITLTHPALVGPVAVAAEGAVGFGIGLTIAATSEFHRNFQCILEAERFDDECVTLLLRAAAQLSLHAERHLTRGDVSVTVWM